jgi:hypothetical protein
MDRFLAISLVALFPVCSPAHGESPSYARHIAPFLTRYCSECHRGDDARGGLDLDTFEALLEGGRAGSSVVAGKPDASPLVLRVEGKETPVMPPRRSKRPRPDELVLLRAWVAAGARDDSQEKGSRPPRVPAKTPVAALAYRPDGKLLAVGIYRQVLLFDPANGDLLSQVTGQRAQVTALAFSRDGKRLAVASGSVGTSGEVRFYSMTDGTPPAATLERTVPAHGDLVHDVAFSPDGTALATCSYDRLVKLWDVATGKELRALKDHSDAVFGVTWSPDGKLLASAAADRAVKVWDVATGRRLYTLGEATDWVYAVAWSPQGQFLAAGGVDKSVRIWEVNAEKGRLAHSAFAHEGAITRLVYSADGKTLYSLSEDRTAKAWAAANLVERAVYSKQADAILSLAVRPDQKQLALGRFDGVAMLVEEATGKVQADLLPIKPKPPQVTRLSPPSGQRGQKVRLTFEGKYLQDVTEVVASHPGVAVQLLPESRTASRAEADVTFPAHTPTGVYKLGLKSAAGQSAQLGFTVDLFPPTLEKAPNGSPSTAQSISLPATVVGKIDRAGEVDFYRFEARAGQQVGVQVLTAAVESKLEPVLQMLDGDGRAVAESTNGLLGHVCVKPGVFTLSIRDREYRGGANMHYRLHVGDIPVITAVYPLGVQRGAETEVQLQGVNLGPVHSARVKAPAAAAVGSRLPVPISTGGEPPLGSPSVVVGEFPEAPGWPANGPQPALLLVPGTANGRLQEPGAADTWRFVARKGQRLILEVNARRLGSPLDSFVEIQDWQGRPVPRAVLRFLAKTYTTFRDHDSAGPGIRLEAWSELAINDYVWVGNELLRIRELPKNPDDDCQFYSVGGQRQGFLDTTPAHLSLGTPMYKVELHPPGKTFPPNGFPVIPVPYCNDDGGPGYGKDSRLFFDPPTDGEYQVRITDARGHGGSEYAYRLTVRPPRPDFAVRFNPTSPSVWKGGGIPISVTADRIDGYEGAIELRLENLPPGFSAPATTIPSGETTTAFTLFAEPAAATPEKAPPLKLIARAVADGRELVHEAQGGLPKTVEPGDLVTVTEQSEVTVRPGQETRLTVKIERRNGHTGRVPLDVRGLPHGVRVLDIGLNGILITEKETSRTVVLYAEPWVRPTTHPFVVLARSERKGTEHAAKSVLLRVVDEQAPRGQ